MGTTGRYMLWSYGCYPLGSQWAARRLRGHPLHRSRREIRHSQTAHAEHRQLAAQPGLRQPPCLRAYSVGSAGRVVSMGSVCERRAGDLEGSIPTVGDSRARRRPDHQDRLGFQQRPFRPRRAELYPGDAYVDVISQDIYWDPIFDVQSDTGPNGEMIDNPVRAFNGHRGRNGGRYTYGLDWMVDFAAAHGKPVSISEFGAVIRIAVAEHGLHDVVWPFL